MSIQTVERSTDERRQRLLPLLTGSAALVLAIAAGAGLWARAGHDDAATDRIRSEAPGTTAPLSEDTTPPIGGMAERCRDQAAADGRSPDRPPTVYVAGSTAQAEAMQPSIDATNHERAQRGLMPDTTVIVASTPEDRDRAIRMLADLNAERVATGLSEIDMIELSGEAGEDGAPPQAEGPLSPIAELPFSVFVVESEIAAVRLPEQLERNLPAGGALPRNPSAEHVLIVGSPEAAATAWVTIERLHATHGRDSVQVVDLRPEPATQQFPVGGGMPPLSDQSTGMP